MTKHDRTGGARPLARRTLRWLAAAAIALLGATQTRADWLFQSSDANYNWVPTIASSDGDWVFEVEELEYNQIRVVTCLFTKQSTGELDFGAPIGDGGSTIYEIVSIGDTGEQSSIFSGSFSPDKVSKLTFPSTLTHIYGNAFYDAFIEGDLSIPNSVTYIGEYAFSGTRFESIEIHAGVAFIGEGAFGRSYGSQLRPVTFMGDYPSSYCGNIYYTSWPNMTHTYIQLANLQNWLDSGQVSDWDPATGTGEFCYFPLTCLDYVPLSPPSAWYWDDVSSPGTPMITNALGWKFSVTVIDTDGGIGQLRVDACVDFPLSSATLDFSGSIVDVGTGIPYEIVSIGDETLQSQLFGGSDSIAKLILPDTVTNIASQAFANAYAHGDLVIPDSVTYIGEFAFYMNNFTSVEIPASVTRIEDDAFGWVLDSVTFTFLGDYPSSGVGDIYGGSWGGTVHTYIQFAHLQNWLDSGQVSNWDPATGTGEFRNFPLTCLDYVPPPSAWYWTSAQGGMITNALGWKFQASASGLDLTLTNCFATPGNATYPLDFSGSIEGGRHIVNIGGGQPQWFGDFIGSQYPGLRVASLVLPDEVEDISYAFDLCWNMTSVDFGGSSLTDIGNYAFFNCRSLTEVTIPDSVKSIGTSAFSTCDSLASLTLGAGLQTIGSCAFNNCSNIVGTLDFPAAVSNIWDSAFENCSKITGISFELAAPSLIRIDTLAFAGCTALAGDLVLPQTLLRVGTKAFDGTALTSITTPSYAVVFAQNAFYTESPTLTAVHYTEGYPLTAPGDPFYYTFGNVTSYVDHAYAHTGSAGSWETNLDPASPPLDDSGAARWEGRPIVCLGHLPPGWYAVTLDPAAPSTVSVIPGYDDQVLAEAGQPMPPITAPTGGDHIEPWVFLGYTNALGKLFYDSTGSSMSDWDPAGGTTLYGMWSSLYTGGDVVFYGNGGDPDLQWGKLSWDANTCTYDSCPPPPSRGGYTFAGWVNALGQPVTQGTSIYEDSPDSAPGMLLVYAQWTEGEEGESETGVHIDVINVSSDGDVMLAWAFAEVETRLGVTAGTDYHYVYFVSTDLVTWDELLTPPLAVRISVTQDQAILYNSTLPPSDRRFFKIMAVKD